MIIQFGQVRLSGSLDGCYVGLAEVGREKMPLTKIELICDEADLATLESLFDEYRTQCSWVEHLRKRPVDERNGSNFKAAMIAAAWIEHQELRNDLEKQVEEERRRITAAADAKIFPSSPYSGRDSD